ncbi:MAG TPA: VIT domain-containing protein [Terriglobales bacterium]|nr:VIT domain-containing protein [Terriglobales bacterium]
MQRKGLGFLVVLFLAAAAWAAPGQPQVTQGSLAVVDKDGQPQGLCPLKHTDVKAEISGFLSRVTVTQHFWNPSKEKIEAVYVFPLPENAAVDDMTMKVGDRTVRGVIKQRDEAQAIYQAARAQGHVAALLDQERPNIFTQSVANILPGAEVTIEISYVELLKYEAGSYEFVFPMVVGPRYIPGAPTGRQGGGWAPDTDRVPDASRITPPVTPPGTRAGHDISIEVRLDAGLPIQNFRCTTHKIVSQRTGESSAVIRLEDQAVIPNKDFILQYDVAGGKIQDALLTHKGKNGGFFALILQPPDRVAESDVTPREIVFVIDTSGSQYGFPLEKSKKLVELALAHLHSQDTFNIITFAGNTQILFPEPVPASEKNLARARALLANLTGGGGTEMMKAIRASMDPSDKQDHLRVVLFFTDGYVGNDMEIIGEVQKHPNARVFTLGIGSSVNRFLIDKMAAAGRGEAEYVTLERDADPVVERLFERVRTPLLTDISIDWGGLPVTMTQPERIPDLFGAKPMIVTGRYAGPAQGTIRLRGTRAGQPFERDIQVTLPADEPGHNVLATLWARRQIDALMSKDWAGLQNGGMKPELQQAITGLGLQFRLMTQFTSFVAVEEMTVTDGGQPRTVQVPVEMPEGVSYQGVFGEDKDEAVGSGSTNYAFRAAAPVKSRGMGGYAPGQAPAAPPLTNTTTVEGRAGQPAAKLHPTLQAAVACLKSGKSGCGATPASKLLLQVWLTDKTPETLAQLKALGFEVVLDPQSSSLVIGRLTAEKLEALSKLKAVRYVAPQV